MEEINIEELNHYIDNKKTLYDLLTGEEYGYYLPNIKSNSLTVEFLLKLGNDSIWIPKSNEIKKVDSKLLQGLDKLTIY